MSTINVTVVDQVATFTNMPIIASGDVGVDKIKFTFDSTWDGYSAKICTFYRQGKKGTYYFAPLNGSNEATIPAGVMREKGKINFAVSAKNASNVVKTCSVLSYNILEGAYTEAADEDHETFEEIKNQMLAIQATIEGKADDFSAEIAEYEANLSSTVDAKIGQYISQSKNAFNLSTAQKWEGKQWSINSSLIGTVLTEPNNSFAATNAYLIPISGNKTYCAQYIRGYSVYLDSDKKVISWLTPSTPTGVSSFTTPANAAYFGFTVYHTLSPAPDMNTFMVYEGSTYPETYVAPGGSVIGYNLAEIAGDIAELKNKEVGVTTSKNAFNLVTAEIHEGYQFYTASPYNLTEWSYGTAYIIPIKPNTTYSINKLRNICVFYDSQKTVISISTANIGGITTITTPANTAYLGIVVWKSYDNVDMNTFMVYEGSTYPETYVAPGDYIGSYNLTEMKKAIDNIGGGSWADKKYLLFGDSYTDENFEQSVCWVSKFKTHLNNANNITNKAIAGAAYAHAYLNNVDANNGFSQVAAAVADTSINPDVIIFFFGHNDNPDTFNDTDIESYFTTDGAMRPLSDMTSLYTSKSVAAMRWCIETAMNTYPNAKIFVCTPCQFGSYNSGSYAYKTPAMLTKRNAIIDVANRMSVEIIDTFNAGLYSNLQDRYWLGNHAHPNNTGATLISNCIIRALKNWYSV